MSGMFSLSDSAVVVDNAASPLPTPADSPSLASPFALLSRLPYKQIKCAVEKISQINSRGFSEYAALQRILRTSSYWDVLTAFSYALLISRATTSRMSQVRSHLNDTEIGHKGTTYTTISCRNCHVTAMT